MKSVNDKTMKDMYKMLTGGVSLVGMKHLNYRNETIFLRNETPTFEYFSYICGEKFYETPSRLLEA